MEQTVGEFLSTSPLARRLSVPGRVVLRRLSMSQAELRTAVQRGVIEIAADAGIGAVCELEVGGEVIVVGSIEERDGTVWFVPKEQRNG